MLIGRQRLDWVARMAFLLLLLFSVGGCTRTYTWTEEVTLKSGEKLVVERKQKYDSSGGEWASATRWNTLREARIRIDGVPVEWVGKNYPLILERWGGSFVVIYIEQGCYIYAIDDERRYLPPHSIDIFKDDAWRHIDVTEVTGVWRRNLVADWREGGYVAGQIKGYQMGGERDPMGGETETYDHSLPNRCKRMDSAGSIEGE